MNELFRDINKTITEAEIMKMARLYDVPYASLMAVIKTEARAEGFYPGTLIPVVRLENHKFHEITKGEFTKSHSHLSSISFNGKFNRKGIGEFDRFMEAYRLNPNGAIWATSWGLGQVMGFNYQVCGYSTLLEFAKGMFVNETNQLGAMMEFIVKNKLLIAMRTQDWKTFARGYNGPKYATNKYDLKLAAFYNEYNK